MVGVASRGFKEAPTLGETKSLRGDEHAQLPGSAAEPRPGDGRSAGAGGRQSEESTAWSCPRRWRPRCERGDREVIGRRRALLQEVSHFPVHERILVGWPDSAAPTIAVRVYDYAGVPPAIAKRAREESGRIFRKAGVATEWILCTIPGQVMAAHPRCATQPLATDIQLNILSARMAREMMRHHSELGIGSASTQWLRASCQCLLSSVRRARRE